MFFLYFYSCMGAVTATILIFLMFLSYAVGQPWNSNRPGLRELLGLGGQVVLSFVAWPVYLVSIVVGCLGFP